MQVAGYILAARLDERIEIGMDKQYPWKRTQELEVDLTDLMRKLCGKWKQAAACALACAVALGGCGWLKAAGSKEAERLDSQEGLELTVEEERAVLDAVQLAKENSSLEAYLDHSVLMQVDAYHKEKFLMLYSIDHAKRQELPKITESYLNFIGNGGAAADLKKAGGSWAKVDRSYLAELITAYQKTYSSPYQVVVDGPADSSLLSESLFYVEVTGKDAESAQQMSLDMQKVLEGYSAKVKKQAGSHKLALVSCVESVAIDSGLQAQQHDKKAQLSANQANLEAMTGAFTKAQMVQYRDAADVEAKEEETEDIGGSAGFGTVIKYMVLGFAAGIFLYGGMFVCRYLFSDLVKSAEEMKRLYVFPFYGDIPMQGCGAKGSAKKSGKRMPAVQQGQLLMRIRLFCKAHGITSFYAVSDFSFEGQEKKCLESIAEQLKGSGVDMAIVENMGMDTAMWDGLVETGNVLVVCRFGTTTHRMVDDAMGFYLESGISVMGAAAFSDGRC